MSGVGLNSIAPRPVTVMTQFLALYPQPLERRWVWRGDLLPRPGCKVSCERV